MANGLRGVAKPDVVKTLKAYKALIFGYLFIKEKV
jgi:hypothetical protein